MLYQAELCPDVWFSAAAIANRPLTDRGWQLLSKAVVFLFCFRLQVNPLEVHQGPPAARMIWGPDERERLSPYGTMRSARKRRKRRQNISSVSTTSWKPNCRALVVLVITSQSEPNT